jgi:hypothetical protein
MYKVYDNEKYSLKNDDYIFKTLAEAQEVASWLEAEAESHGDSQHWFYIRDLTTGSDVY